MPSRSLPPRPSLVQLKIQADELRRAHRQGELSAAARIVANHPRWKGLTLQAALDRPLALADAQIVLAREYGFDNWARLKRHVETARPGRAVPAASALRRRRRRDGCPAISGDCAASSRRTPR